MPKRKSKIFVGSSSEAEEIASHFSNKLRTVATVVFWKDAPEFRVTYSTMDNLLEAAKRYDYGFFIFTPDDRYLSRGKEGTMGRDNVLFEFGLFLGALGPDRVFAVVQAGDTDEERLKTPSDLWGIQMPRFRKLQGADFASEVDGATYQIRNQINKLGPVPLGMYPITKWGFDYDSSEFTVTLDKHKLREFSEELVDSNLCIVVRKQDTDINNNEDTHIAISNTRKLPKPLNADMTFTVKTSGKIQPVVEGDIVEGYLFLIPPNCNIESVTKIEQMFEMGCELLEDVGRTVN